MKKKELDKIIARHQHWLHEDIVGYEKMKADLSKAYLPDADLHGADLPFADLPFADLRGADLSKANLSGAHLSFADLTGADLTGADLSGADLSFAKLAKAKLPEADLSGADLFFAKLAKAKLSEANLSKANLSGAELKYANLDEADLTDADLDGANLEHADIYTAKFSKKNEFRKGIVLTKPIKGYKKTKEGVVITAEIPAGVPVFSINGSKCRTCTATITDMGGHKLLHSWHDPYFTYRVGKKILISDFDTRYNVECSKGFHFFRTRKEAQAY